jgi:hypothetical protein
MQPACRSSIEGWHNDGQSFHIEKRKGQSDSNIHFRGDLQGFGMSAGNILDYKGDDVG